MGNCAAEAKQEESERLTLHDFQNWCAVLHAGYKGYEAVYLLLRLHTMSCHVLKAEPNAQNVRAM